MLESLRMVSSFHHARWPDGQTERLSNSHIWSHRSECCLEGQNRDAGLILAENMTNLVSFTQGLHLREKTAFFTQKKSRLRKYENAVHLLYAKNSDLTHQNAF